MQEIRRYSLVAICLHWAIAALILFNIAIGRSAMEAIESKSDLPGGFYWLQFHKSIGVTILALTLVRLAWRVVKRPPAPIVTGWQGRAAAAMHHLFYVLMIAIPIGGLAVGTAKGFPTVYFGLFQLPDVPFLPRGGEAGMALGETIGEIHGTLAWLWLALIGLHVAAALKHHFIDRDATLARIIPGLSLRRS